MRPVVTAEEMRRCDARAIRGYGIPGLLLMEHAGNEVSRWVAGRYGPLQGKRILVLCGKGNNGGDGFVAARRLLDSEATIDVVLTASPGQLTGDARLNYSILKSLARTHPARLSIRQYSPRFRSRHISYDLIIDALFGTGFSGAVREPYRSLLPWVNNQGVPVVAIDIPSGVNGSTGRAENLAVRATETVTLGAWKTGLLCNEGRDLAGRVEVADIGIPASVYASVRPITRLVERSDVAAALPKRASTVHKYSVGKVLIVAGSKGYTGAAALAASSALKSGAGAVVLLTPESVYPILARKLTEVIVRPLPATAEGTLANHSLGAILEQLKWADVTVVGPGLSQQPETQELTRSLLAKCRGRLVIDADGLNALASLGMRRMKRMKADCILTPHTGECARLVGLTSVEVDTHRVDVARKLAKSIGQTIVLKGAPTATAVSEGDVYLNSTGNPGMATVGSGDVLTGLIASLWAQGTEPRVAAFAGAYLHGLAGDLASEKVGVRSVVAQDLVDYLPEAFRAVEERGRG
jgi:hydroxyethylthiazole kinase-like uncharacterized protein yjeF